MFQNDNVALKSFQKHCAMLSGPSAILFDPSNSLPPVCPPPPPLSFYLDPKTKAQSPLINTAHQLIVTFKHELECTERNPLPPKKDDRLSGRKQNSKYKRNQHRQQFGTYEKAKTSEQKS